ncbi:MAG: 16S rRNA (cytosine(1402)-N(4))-methyltransferase RsmH [Myxococcota bacterium]
MASLHTPVMFEEVMKLLNPGKNGCYLDATVGYGGHSAGILEAMGGEGLVIGIDRDEEAVAYSRERFKEFGKAFIGVHSRFGRAREVLDQLGVPSVDGIIADFGASSPQFDNAERGFSFRNPGALDMRMDRSGGETLFAYLTRVTEEELSEVFYQYGELMEGRRLARAVLRAVSEGRIKNTLDLAEAINDASRKKSRSLPPATLAFMALRIKINDELNEIDKLLSQLPSLLNEGGRAVFISFHSLEDRAVKRWIREKTKSVSPRRGLPSLPESWKPSFENLTPKALTPSVSEAIKNPRAKSAKLRAVQKSAEKGENDGCK